MSYFFITSRLTLSVIERIIYSNDLLSFDGKKSMRFSSSIFLPEDRVGNRMHTLQTIAPPP